MAGIGNAQIVGFAVIGLVAPCFSGVFGVDGGRGKVGDVKAVGTGQAASPEVAGGESSDRVGLTGYRVVWGEFLGIFRNFHK